MELTIQEITFLYQIMKVKGIVGFDQFPMLSQKEANEGKRSLLHKDILVEDTITTYGYSVLDTLFLYTKAKVYYKFGKDSVFANYTESEYIMIQKRDTIFHVELLTQDMLSTTILTKFKDWKSVEDYAYKKRFLSKEKFRKYMEIYEDVQAMYYYKIDIETQREASGVLFINEGYLQNYNGMSGELDMYPRNQVQKGIERLFVREISWQQ